MLELFIFDTKEYSTAVGNQIEPIKFLHGNSSLTIFPSITCKLFEIGRNATFAGMYFNISNGFQGMDILICKMLGWASDRSVGYKIKVPPQYIEPDLYPALDSIFSSKGARVTIETNQHLEVCNKDFLFHFSDTNKKLVRRSIDKEFLVSIQLQLSQDGYDLLRKNRERRGVVLSIPFNDLKHQSEAIPNSYIFFECKNRENKLIAYAVCVKIRRDILYVLYWGEDYDHRKESPVVFLAKSILDFCIDSKIAYLDAGISSLNGNLDQGLYDFKSRLGFKPSSKYIIESIYA